MNDVFSKIIESLDACKSAVTATGATIGRSSQTQDPRLPSGCLLQPSKKRAGLKMAGASVAGPVYNLVYNNVSDAKVDCGNRSSVALSGVTSLGPVILGLEHNTATVIITLTGDTRQPILVLVLMTGHDRS